jgi:MerR family transcriptional regulator, light-induced transcriptional regulator
MLQHEFPIAIAAQRAGLSQHVIRAWEKRYGAIVPSRTGTKRRLYSEQEIERLQLLKRATQAGHSIGNIAALSTEALRNLAADAKTPSPVNAESAPSMLAACWTAVQNLDAASFERILQSGLANLGRANFLRHVIIPLIENVGHAWEAGTLRIAHEHLSTTVIRTLLGNFVQAHSPTSNAPTLVATTPPGQHHELGALIAGAIATDHGWNVVYLGPTLPTEEIAAAIHQCKADALALSIVYPADDRGLPLHLKMIRTLLPGTPLLVGGRSAYGYKSTLQEIDATVCNSLEDIVSALDSIRKARAL